jgi:subtilisin-like proprotein convertase family protein
MKFPSCPTIGVLFLAGSLAANANPKTASPVKINENEVNTAPYRYNGVVLAGNFRGSGFCAWNKRTFFSAAHVLYGEDSWLEPPTWHPANHSATLDDAEGISSRGYYRWANYANLVAWQTSSQKEFGRDVILAFAFRDFIQGSPARLNLNGSNDLKRNIRTMITGYPADNLYVDESIDGYFMHRTGPLVAPYRPFSGRALTTTLVTTGHGNSGGPIWTKDAKSNWRAAGVLVGGLPSETIIYAFSSDVDSLTRAATPVIKRVTESSNEIGSVDASSLFFPYKKEIKIPDGKHSWTSVPIEVDEFPEFSKLKSLKLSIDIRTAHRGDLQVALEGPGGVQVAVHNEQGAGKSDLIIKNRDFTAAFAGIDPNGKWYLRVQDRLVGDVAKLKSILLEIAVDDAPIVGPDE